MTGVGSLDGYIELICPVRNLETEGFVDELEDGPPGLITGKVEAVYQRLERFAAQVIADDMKEAGPGPDQGQEAGGGALQPRHDHLVLGVRVGQRGEGGEDDGHSQTQPRSQSKVAVQPRTVWASCCTPAGSWSGP